MAGASGGGRDYNSLGLLKSGELEVFVRGRWHRVLVHLQDESLTLSLLPEVGTASVGNNATPTTTSASNAVDDCRMRTLWSASLRCRVDKTGGAGRLLLKEEEELEPGSC